MFSAIIIYAAVLLLASVGIISNKKNGDRKLRSYSIIVIAKNEEENLPALLKSISGQDYPEKLFEIILVDDNSDDNTFRLMKEKAQQSDNIRVLHVAKKLLPGKKEGLQQALEAAKNEIILLTDADCIVSPDWLNSYNQYFDEKTVLIVGYAPEIVRGKGLSATFRRFISLASAGVYAATVGLGMPFSCAGRNIAVRREELLALGGYKSMTANRSGDDKELLNLIRKNNGQIKYNSEKTVLTHPETNAFIEQQKRRFGKLKMSSPLHLILTVIILSFYIILPFYFIMASHVTGFVIFYAASLLIWFVNLIKHKESFNILDPVIILIYPYYVLSFTVLGSFGKWIWK